MRRAWLREDQPLRPEMAGASIRCASKAQRDAASLRRTPKASRDPAQYRNGKDQTRKGNQMRAIFYTGVALLAFASAAFATEPSIEVPSIDLPSGDSGAEILLPLIVIGGLIWLATRDQAPAASNCETISSPEILGGKGDAVTMSPIVDC